MKIHFNKNTLFLILLSLAMIAVTTLPYLWNYFERPIDTAYTWSGLYNPGDLPVYYSYIEQTRQGRYAFIDLFTGEIQTQRFFNIFWLAVGLMARWLNIAAPIAFQLARILLIPLFIWTLKKTIDFFYPTKHWRILLTASLFVSGFGVLLMPFINRVNESQISVGLDLAAAEATPFTTMIFTGHFIFSWICMLWSIMFTIKGFREQKFLPTILAGLINLIFFQFHPYYAPFIFAFTFFVLVYNLIKKPQIKNLLLASLPVIISLPSIFYYAYLWANDQRFYNFSQQNFTPTPAWWVVLLTFGFLSPLALAGIIILWRQKKWQENYTYLLFWLIIGNILLFMPFNTQRRFIEGLLIPTGIFALIALKVLMNKIPIKLYNSFPKIFIQILLSVFFVIFFGFSSILSYQLSFRLNYLAAKNLYLSQTANQTINWLKENTAISDLFLSPDDSTNIIAGLSGRQFYGWHLGETTYAPTKKRILESFFTTAFDTARIKFLKENRITKIYWSNESALQYSFRPEEKNYLTKIYDNGDVKIYAVN